MQSRAIISTSSGSEQANPKNIQGWMSYFQSQGITLSKSTLLAMLLLLKNVEGVKAESPVELPSSDSFMFWIVVAVATVMVMGAIGGTTFAVIRCCKGQCKCGSCGSGDNYYADDSDDPYTVAALRSDDEPRRCLKIPLPKLSCCSSGDEFNSKKLIEGSQYGKPPLQFKDPHDIDQNYGSFSPST